MKATAYHDRKETHLGQMRDFFHPLREVAINTGVIDDADYFTLGGWVRGDIFTIRAGVFSLRGEIRIQK
jgi:hypothetical protein